MENYKRKFKEASPAVQDLLNELKDMKLTNDDNRKEFIKIITHVALSNEPIARSFIREVGKALSPIINEILNSTSSLKLNGGSVEYRTGGTINMDTSNIKSSKVNKL